MPEVTAIAAPLLLPDQKEGAWQPSCIYGHRSDMTTPVLCRFAILQCSTSLIGSSARDWPEVEIWGLQQPQRAPTAPQAPPPP